MVAIVRGSSDEKAAERLRSGFYSGDPQLLQRFDALSKHLAVYAGLHPNCITVSELMHYSVLCTCPWLVVSWHETLDKGATKHMEAY